MLGNVTIAVVFTMHNFSVRLIWCGVTNYLHRDKLIDFDLNAAKRGNFEKNVYSSVEFLSGRLHVAPSSTPEEVVRIVFV